MYVLGKNRILIDGNKILRTGIQNIDVQYMEIVEWTNWVLENRSRDTVMAKVSFLLNYAGFHFDIEEHYMAIFEYPGLGEHKEAHDFFRESVMEILEAFIKYGETSDILDKINDYAIPWIIEHYQTFDEKMAVFLRSVV